MRYRRRPWDLSVIWAMLAAVGVSVLVQSCATSPVAQAETLEQRVYAVYGTFVIMEERVATMVEEDSTLPRDVQLGMIRAVQAAEPAIDSMLAGYASYLEARAQFAAGMTNPERIAVVTANLASWVEEADGLVDSLREVARGGD